MVKTSLFHLLLLFLGVSSARPGVSVRSFQRRNDIWIQCCGRVTNLFLSPRPLPCSSASCSGFLTSFQYHREFEMKSLRVEEVPPTEDAPYAFKIINPIKSFVVKTTGQQEKIDWLLDIQKVHLCSLCVCVCLGCVNRKENLLLTFIVYYCYFIIHIFRLLQRPILMAFKMVFIFS